MSSAGTEPKADFDIVIPICDTHICRSSISTCFSSKGNENWCLNSFCDKCMFERSDVCKIHPSLKRVSHLLCTECFDKCTIDVKKGKLPPEPSWQKNHVLDDYCAHIWPNVPSLESSKESFSEVCQVSAVFYLYSIFSIVVFTSKSL